MRRAVLISAMGLCVLTLAGCGKKDDTPKVETSTDSNGNQSVTITDNKGTQITMNAGLGASTNMPSFAPMYPRGSVEATVSTPNKGGMVTFKTSDAAADVIAFYKKSATGAGFKDNYDATSGDTTTFSASNADSTHALSVVVTKSDAGTQVQVTWN